jgi:PhnB protein
MLNVTPYLGFPGTCRAAIEFYQKALDAQVVFISTVGESPMPEMGPAENIMHATIRVGESEIMMSDQPGETTASPQGPVSLAIGLNDEAAAARIFDNLAEGGTVIMPLAKTYWAASFGMLTDKFGIRWMVNCEGPPAA